MPFGFGRGFGRGFGWGVPYGYEGYGVYPRWGWGRGRGNPYFYCRNFPWLPRWWWATPNAAQYASTIPYYGSSPAPYINDPYYAAQVTPEQELDMLKGQTEILEDELDGIRKRIKEIESSKKETESSKMIKK